MIDLLISLGWGTLSMTKEKAEKTVDTLVKKGEIQREEAKTLLKEIMERGEKEKEEFRQHIKNEVQNALQKSDLVTRDEYKQLESRISVLEEKINRSENDDKQGSS